MSTSHACCPTGSGETPSLDTIDSYMKKLHSIIVSSPQEHENLINTVRDVVNRLDRWELLYMDGFHDLNFIASKMQTIKS